MHAISDATASSSHFNMSCQIYADGHYNENIMPAAIKTLAHISIYKILPFSHKRYFSLFLSIFFIFTYNMLSLLEVLITRHE